MLSELLSKGGADMTNISAISGTPAGAVSMSVALAF